MQRLDRQYTDGHVTRSHGTDIYPVTSAITGEQIAEGVLGDAVDADAAVQAAHHAFPAWAATPLSVRREYLLRLAETFARHREEMVASLVEEFGTTTVTASFIVDESADWFRDAAALLTPSAFAQRTGRATVRKVPVGVAVLITPWNGASWSIAMKASAALAAGCTVVIKPSERGIWQTQGVLGAIAEADLPAGVINLVFGRADPVGDVLTSHPDVSKISITGSTATGKTVARHALETMKRVTLELGGKSPTVILDDAVPAVAATIAARVGLFNNGQACTAGTRILIPANREAEFKDALVKAVGDLAVGDPRAPETAVGPVLDRAQYDRVQSYIRAGIDAGGQVLTGGLGHPDDLERGNYVKPTLITATNGDSIAREEIFGPVLAVITYRDEDDAVAIANDTEYGLQAYVVGDPRRAERVAERLQAGRVMINGAVGSREAPFGGFKQSGVGREFGRWGIEEYLEVQAIFGG